MRSRRLVTPDEARIWRAVIRDAVPLPGRIVPEAGEEVPLPAPPRASPPPPPPPLVTPKPTVPPLALHHGYMPGLDKRSAQRMKKGEMAIEAVLDLHGHTQDLAHVELNAFIQRAFAQGRRCVLVVTGKGSRGGGILKAQVPRWLNQSPLRERVLGFSHARPQHGGEGALYVLVKRQRP